MATYLAEGGGFPCLVEGAHTLQNLDNNRKVRYVGNKCVNKNYILYSRMRIREVGINYNRPHKVTTSPVGHI